MIGPNRRCLIPRILGGIVFVLHALLLFLLIDWPFGTKNPAANPMLILLGVTLVAYLVALQWPLHGSILMLLGAISLGIVYLFADPTGAGIGILSAIAVFPQVVVGSAFFICWWKAK